MAILRPRAFEDQAVHMEFLFHQSNLVAALAAAKTLLTVLHFHLGWADSDDSEICNQCVLLAKAAKDPL